MTARRGPRAGPPSGAELFPEAFRFEDGLGRCVGVALDAAAFAAPGSIVRLLHPDERMLCRDMRGPRLVEFAGGRIAARIARAGLPGGGRPTLRGADGRPFVPGGPSVSISHTRRFAVALAGRSSDRAVGVDIEDLAEGPGLDLLAERILSAAERAARPPFGAMPLLQRLSLKEAAYKAVAAVAGPIPLRDIRVAMAGGRIGIALPRRSRGLAIRVTARVVGGHALSSAVAAPTGRSAGIR